MMFSEQSALPRIVCLTRAKGGHGMSKFNNRPTGMTTNSEGLSAYAMEDKSKLVTQVLTSFFNEQKF